MANENSGVHLVLENLNSTPGAVEEDLPTPKLVHNPDLDLLEETSTIKHWERVRSMYVEFVDDFTGNASSTPPKRPRDSIGFSPSKDQVQHDETVKRHREKTLAVSYTDPTNLDGFFLPSHVFINPDDIDGVPLDTTNPNHPAPPTERRVTQLVLPPAPSRPLIRRATDFPLPPPSPTQTHAPSPRSAAIILSQVLELEMLPPLEDPVKVWRRKRDDHTCPLCLGVLVRPVDPVGCGHHVCRTHVIDMYQHGGSKNGIRCPVCRQEDKVDDFNRIHVDQKLWLKIQRAKFHHSKRKSVSPSRSLTPLRERFEKTFLQDEDF